MGPPVGEAKDNWVTVAATVGNAHVDKDITCPTGKEWTVEGGSMSHDDSVGHTMTISLFNSDDKLLQIFMVDAGGAGARPIVQFPTGALVTASELSMQEGFPLTMKAGDYVRFAAAVVMTDASVAWEYVLRVREVDAP